MSSLRVLWRAPALGLATFFWALLWCGGLPVAIMLARREPWRGWVFQRWARTVACVLGMRVEREGDVPSEPVLLVSNHLSYVDIVLIASQMRCVFVSKAEVASWPVLGRLAGWMQTVFIDRERRRDVTRVAREIDERLARGQSVVVFPEGTSTDGSGVLDFRSSLLAPAARESWSVRHAALRYVTPVGEPPASVAVCWWGDMSFGPHLMKLFALPSFRARIAFGAEPISDPDRKSLARRLQRAVASRFGSLFESEESCPIGA